MTLQAHELLETYHHLYRIFPEDLHVSRPLIQVFQKKGQNREAYQLALELGRRMLASGRTSFATAFLRLCKRIHPEPDDEIESMLAISEVMADEPQIDGEKVFSLIEKLSDQEALGFIRQANLITCPKGDKLIAEGEVGDQFYLILQGAMGVHIRLSDDRDLKIKVLKDGDYFGEYACIYQLPRTATIIADEDTLLLEFPDTAISKLMEQSPDAGAILMEIMQQRLIQSMTHAHPAFTDVIDGDQDWLAEESEVLEIATGQSLAYDPDEKCYIMVHGCLIASYQEEGDTKEWLFYKNQMFSGLDAHVALPDGAALVARERSLVCCVSAEIFDSFMRAYFSFEHWVESQGEA